METKKVKLPSHLSNVYKKMVAEGLINDQKEYVGEIPLDEYLKSFETAPEYSLEYLQIHCLLCVFVGYSTTCYTEKIGFQITLIEPNDKKHQTP